jgi:glycosyltransferase involved in cell wall biosynthesis
VNVLLTDSALRTKMGRSSRRRVEEQFSWVSIARQTLELYEHVVANHR